MDIEGCVKFSHNPWGSSIGPMDSPSKKVSCDDDVPVAAGTEA